ncbi:MAG: YfaP family protein [bacterium]|nr:YfaP family protein [bacterium]
MNKPEHAQQLQQVRWLVAGVYSFILHALILVIMALILLSSIHEPEITISSEFVDHAGDELLDSRLEMDNLGVEVTQVNLLDLNVIPQPDIVLSDNQLQRSVNQISQGIENAIEGRMQKGSGSGFAVFKSRLNRENAQTGDVQVSLIWGDVNDIDLHVMPPSKERIWFDHKRSRCLGCLDVDMNVSPPFSLEPVENIFWPEQKAPSGQYHIFVHYYANNGGPDRTAVQIMLTINGVSYIIEDEVKKGTPPKPIFSFEYPLSAGTKLKLALGKKRREQKEKLALEELKKLEEFLKDKPQVAPQRFRKFAERFSGTLAADKATALAAGQTWEAQ